MIRNNNDTRPLSKQTVLGVGTQFFQIKGKQDDH